MMPLTLEEVKEKLKDMDEITLLEALEIYSDDIVDRFSDKIEDAYDKFVNEFEEDNNDNRD